MSPRNTLFVSPFGVSASAATAAADAATTSRFDQKMIGHTNKVLQRNTKKQTSANDKSPSRMEASKEGVDPEVVVGSQRESVTGRAQTDTHARTPPRTSTGNRATQKAVQSAEVVVAVEAKHRSLHKSAFFRTVTSSFPIKIKLRFPPGFAEAPITHPAPPPPL
uniref:Secreted protein n=1 Tax=Mesocestoides corti TaxID=53468 RepID=A0A5K3ERT1_MESCO